MLTSTLLLSLSLTQTSIAGYALKDAYTPSNFFNSFNFFTGDDPTQGTVKFVDQNTAQSAGLISANGSSVKFGVEHSNPAPNGRMSVRLESKQSYDQGLIIADIAHMPGSICGTWPAFWTVGPDWPMNGEIDIIEGVNSEATNSMTLHTRAGCKLSSAPAAANANQKFTGSIKTSNCDVNAAGQGMNVGCGIGTRDTMTYGDGFNNEGGGVYATEWTGEAIRVFHFVRSNIPADILAGTPDPTTWGAPLALFTGCDFDSYVKNQTIVFDTTFCGQWAGSKDVWQADAVCSKKAATCEDHVKNNPADFAGAYWDVNSVKVYQQNGGFIGSAPAAPKPSTTSTMSYTQGIPPAMTPSTMLTMTAPVGPAGAVQSVRTVTVEMTTTMTMTVDSPGAGVGAGTGIPSPLQSMIPTTATAPLSNPQATPSHPGNNGRPLDVSDFPGEGRPGGVPGPAKAKRDGAYERHFLMKHRRRALGGHGHVH
ncbi:hypothetical protein EG328_001423 [Venturia inaequalis]|uniref:endo-1,3(4)-beta-glucanase n=1 Tax=Venturia inaequalis TaxID=5025 RepID=A0A8H3V0G5_VENIN|nr:hypothetical protein EG328_001423 [Venturia inaequalis]